MMRRQLHFLKPPLLALVVFIAVSPVMAQAPQAAQPASAQPAAANVYDAAYARGVEAYKKRDYHNAAELFWKSITDGNPGSTVWLYLANSRAGEGNLEEARKNYKSVTDIFKGSEEAKAAANYIRLIDSGTWHPGPAKTAGAAKPAAAAAPVSAAPAGPAHAANLISRITVIPPRDGHIAVSNQTLRMIKETVNELPPAIAKTLDEGGVKIFVGPNIIDKWPDSINIPKPGPGSLTLAEEPGRTYGRDIYVYERSVITPGVTTLGDLRLLSDLKSNFLHEVGHALDDSMSTYSKDRDLQRQYQMDSDGISEENRTTLAYYLQTGDTGPSEACAELVSIFFGGTHRNNDLMVKCFPRTETWLKAKLKVK